MVLDLEQVVNDGFGQKVGCDRLFGLKIVNSFWVYNGRTNWYNPIVSIERNKFILQTRTTTQKENRLSIRATEPEKAILAQAAKARHTNLSQFVLQASLDAANAILVDQTEFRLPLDQWEAFCQRLDAPPKVILELRQLFSEQEPF